MATWYSFDEGKTLGTRGSEHGVIVRDEEHAEGARITLEQGGSTAPYAITLGVYSVMMHTHFCGSQEEAEHAYNELKILIERVITSWDPNDRSGVDAAIDALMAAYP